MKCLTVLAIAALATATEYPITGTPVHCRSSPSTDADIVKSYKKDDMVTITCQTEGTKFSGTTIWDKTGDGCYVSDFLIKTGSKGYFTTKCAASGNSTTSATSEASEAPSSSEDACPPLTSAAGNATTMPGGVVPTGSAPIGGSPTASQTGGNGGSTSASAPAQPTAAAGELAASVMYAAVPIVLGGLLQFL